VSSMPPGAPEAPCPVCAGPTAAERRFGDVPLRRCADCGFTLLVGDVDPDLYGDRYFETYAGGDYLAHEARRRRESRLRLRLLARVAPPPGRLLEVGAAAGFFLDEARTAGYDGKGVEPNPAMAAFARARLRLDVRTGTLGETALDPGSFDAVCAFHVLEHIDRPLEAARSIHGALRPGGHLLVEVPNAESATARRRGAHWPPLDLPHHVGHHGPRSLRTLLERAGFQVLLVDTVPFAYYGGASRASRLARGLLEAARSGAALPAGPHPHGNQLLRAVARRPPA
jgi:SAM-dependent methyltransferase